jgi:hypothetical protein
MVLRTFRSGLCFGFGLFILWEGKDGRGKPVPTDGVFVTVDVNGTKVAMTML